MLRTGGGLLSFGSQSGCREKLQQEPEPGLVVEHLSSSHRNDSHDPAGSHYFTTPALSRRPDGGEDDDSYGLL